MSAGRIKEAKKVCRSMKDCPNKSFRRARTSRHLFHVWAGFGVRDRPWAHHTLLVIRRFQSSATAMLG
jgi:hypothetical protein